MRNVRRKLIALVRCPNKKLFLRAVRRSFCPNHKLEVNLESNLKATYNWICLAQDSTPDDGVAALYNSLHGWQASYPETTGYIIPTFLAYAKAMNEPEARDRALRMAHWEIEVQLPSGAVRGGNMESPVRPAVFNTGQVLFGWTVAYQETQDERFIKAATRAGQWLVDVIDDDGAWRKQLSAFFDTDVHTYNVLTASRLALAGLVMDKPMWVQAGRASAEWTLTQQKENGWFRNCSMAKNRPPSLHPIAYTQEGFLTLGQLFNEEKYIDAAVKSLEPLIRKVEKAVGLKGEYDLSWNEAVRWKCLVGDAQVAVVLYRLARYSERYKDYVFVARKILEELACIQDVESPYPESRGAVAGSEPFWGGYGRYCYPNWAAKYYLDALLLGVRGVDSQPNCA